MSQFQNIFQKSASGRMNIDMLKQGSEGSRYKMEEFGAALPIAVRETLALQKGAVRSSVQCNESEHIWLIVDRQLLIWNLSSVASQMTQLHELTLPFSNIPHVASLVGVFASSHAVSCVAASPAGLLRYWPDVSHSGSYCDMPINNVREDEECRSLIVLKDGTCVLSTSKSRLFLVAPVSAQRTLRVRELHGGSGMLTGLGRRVSSIFWGAQSQSKNSTSFQQLIAGESLGLGKQAFYVLCGPHLQKWAMEQEQEKLLYQCDVEVLFRENVAQEIWGEAESRLPKLKTWLLDMQLNSDGLVVLGAALNPDVSSAMHYGLGTLHTEGDGLPQSFLSFCVPAYTKPYQSEQEEEVLSYSLLKANPSSDMAFMYDRNTVLCLSVSKSGESVEKIQFSSPREELIGAGTFRHQNLFFSRQHGLLVMRENMASQECPSESFLDTSSKVDTCLINSLAMETPADVSMSQSKVSRLKIAFFDFCRGNKGEAEKVLEELFPSGLHDIGCDSSGLDVVVTQLSRDMIDDYPAADPRWAESQSKGSESTTSSLLLLQQLEDKLKAHDIFIRFLCNMQLWSRLSSVELLGSRQGTRYMITEHAEKVTAALALRKLHNKYSSLLDTCIESVVADRGNIEQRDSLTFQDHFYREVSSMNDVYAELVAFEEEQVNISSADFVSLITKVNEIIHATLAEVKSYRAENSSIYNEYTSAPSDLEYQPWTASSGPTGLRSIITKQCRLTCEKGLGCEEDPMRRDQFFQQLMALSEILLDGYRSQLDSIRAGAGPESVRYVEILHQYESVRQKLLDPFVVNGQYDRARSLAEKYHDFHVLIELCEATKNHDNLQRYIQQFSGQGFLDFLFKWYVEKGKRGQILCLDQLVSHPHLSHFLQAQENQFMGWLHNISANEFLKAHSTLYDLAREEKNNFNKKKTLLSLSKLSAWATKDPPDLIHNNWEAINKEQCLMLHQEQIPDSILEKLGWNSDTMNVFSPSELIKLYTGDINNTADEFDFKKAIDILSLVEKEPNFDGDRELLLMEIWSHAVLKDRWEELDCSNPVESARNTVFYRTVELIHQDGMDLSQYLPAKQRLLTSPQLSILSTKTKFDFLLGALYEHILQQLVKA